MSIQEGHYNHFTPNSLTLLGNRSWRADVLNRPEQRLIFLCISDADPQVIRQTVACNGLTMIPRLRSFSNSSDAAIGGYTRMKLAWDGYTRKPISPKARVSISPPLEYRMDRFVTKDIIVQGCNSGRLGQNIHTEGELYPQQAIGQPRRHDAISQTQPGQTVQL